jgi:hypothetical protein
LKKVSADSVEATLQLPAKDSKLISATITMVVTTGYPDPVRLPICTVTCDGITKGQINVADIHSRITQKLGRLSLTEEDVRVDTVLTAASEFMKTAGCWSKLTPIGIPDLGSSTVLESVPGFDTVDIANLCDALISGANVAGYVKWLQDSQFTGALLGATVEQVKVR